jgi:hypothetical protein
VAGAALLSVAVATAAGDRAPSSSDSTLQLEGRRIGAVSGATAPAVAVTQERRFAPAPPGLTLAKRIGELAQHQPAVVDPTVITSIVKTWQPTTLTWDLALTWSGGAAPYTISKSTTPSFEHGVTTLGAEISGNGYTDQTTMDAVDKFFFSVTDPTVISPAA